MIMNVQVCWESMKIQMKFSCTFIDILLSLQQLESVT